MGKKTRQKLYPISNFEAESFAKELGVPVKFIQEGEGNFYFRDTIFKIMKSRKKKTK